MPAGLRRDIDDFLAHLTGDLRQEIGTKVAKVCGAFDHF
jgi:hypothetical protein